MCWGTGKLSSVLHRITESLRLKGTSGESGSGNSNTFSFLRPKQFGSYEKPVKDLEFVCFFKFMKFIAFSPKLIFYSSLEVEVICSPTAENRLYF